MRAPHPAVRRALPPILAAILVSAAASSADAADRPEDLPGMQQAYGWRTVATVVDATTSGDVSLGDAHAELQRLGLDRVRFPVREGTQGRGGLDQCGWNQGVSCRWQPPAELTSPQLGCATSGRLLKDVSLRVTVATVATAESPAEAWVEDLQACWRAGGNEAQVLAEPTVAADPLVTVTGSAGEEMARQFAALTADLRACRTGRLTWVTAEDGRTSIARVDHPTGRIDRQATLCAQSALGRVRLSGPATLMAEPPAPSPEPTP